MNLSYNWLCELVDCGLSPAQMARRLTFAGAAVEEIEPVGADHRLVTEVTTNRPDWLCHWGVARELAALTRKTVALPQWSLPAGGPPVESLTSVTVEEGARDWCPRYTARVIRGIKVGPSPDWLQQRLLAIGQRPINNIVDVTNLVMFETNEPLHAFDFNRLAGGRIIVRRARAGESFQAITGESGTLAEDMLVIADARRAAALAGVKGGADSGVTAATTDILLEAAWFEPAQVRRTSRRTGMASESSYRFERGVDPGGVERASARAAALILELAGGELAAGVIDTGPRLGAPRELEMRFSRCEKVLGTRVEPVEIADIFQGLGLEMLYKDASRIQVRVPSFRQDLTREVDLIEEVIRVAGYERVSARVGLPLVCAQATGLTSCLRRAREALVSLGYHECVTDAFVPAAWLTDFPCADQVLRIQNPVNARRPCLRTQLVPSLLEVRALNREARDVRIFECKHVYRHGEERTHLGLLDDRGGEYVRGALEEVLACLHSDVSLELRPAEVAPALEPGSGARLLLDGREAGWLGVVADGQQKLHDLELRPGVLEFDLEQLANFERRQRVFRALPRFPAVRRDIALEVPEEVLWARIEAEVKNSAQEFLESLFFQSVYRGPGLEPGYKSMAMAVVYRSPGGSLTDGEANALRDELVTHMINNIHGARLRQQ